MAAFERLTGAIVVGFLIGLDRERAEADKLFAGVRTFPLVALAGAVPMLLLDVVGPARLVPSFVGVGAVAVVSDSRSRVFSEAQARALVVYLRQMTSGSYR
jgi:uncharacterized membrane protein YhiD involved in acid resistance